MNNNEEIVKIIKVISIIILLIAIGIFIHIYNHYSFGVFQKAESVAKTCEFSRDSNIKVGNNWSYKIENKDFADGMFFKDVEVIPNTNYKVTCKVKTENVATKSKIDGGALISIGYTSEQSKAITGTNDWQTLEFDFCSKNRYDVRIGFRLGGNDGDARGTVWFSDMKIESARPDENNKWNLLCILVNDVDVNIENNGFIRNYKYSLSERDKNQIKLTFGNLKNSIKRISGNRMEADTTIVEENIPITSMSYSNEHQNYVAPIDAKEILDKYIDESTYDFIFIVFRTGDGVTAIPTGTWLGLGSMEYRNVGFANIRVSNNSESQIYNLLQGVNGFPEEVFIHEFCHTLEKNSPEWGYDVPDLHNNTAYGYTQDPQIGLYYWYRDYMQKNINYRGEKTGIQDEMYYKKPVKPIDFDNSQELDEFKEPNFFEGLGIIFKRIFNGR